MSTSPAVIASRLIELSSQLEEAVKELGRLGEDAARADLAAELTYARSFLGVTGPEYYRKQVAAEAAAQERFTAKVANHLVTTKREAIRALHVKIDVGRTLAANARAEIDLDKVNFRP